MTHPDYDPDLDRLGAALRASTTIDLANEDRVARSAQTPARVGGTRLLKRRRFLAAGTLGVAGVGAALVVALGTSATAPAFAVTESNNGSVLVTLNYEANQNLPQVNAKLAAMGTGEGISIYEAAGAATVSGPVACTPAPGASGPTVKVLEGTDGTEVIGAGQSAGNTAEGTFHLVRCVTSDIGSGNSGNTGNVTTSVRVPAVSSMPSCASVTGRYHPKYCRLSAG